MMLLVKCGVVFAIAAMTRISVSILFSLVEHKVAAVSVTRLLNELA